MYNNFYPKSHVWPVGRTHKILLIMKLTIFLLVSFILEANAGAYAQKVTLFEKKSSINQVFEEISNQTGFDFLFSTSMLNEAKTVSIQVKNAELDDVLKKLFAGQPFTYVIVNKSVVVSKKEQSVSDSSQNVTISGRILEAKDPPVPLPGVTITIAGTSMGTVTDANGFFKLSDVPVNSTLRITMIGYKPQEYLVRKAKADLTLSLFPALSELDEVVVTGIGKQKVREIASSVTTINMENLIDKPVTQLSQALQGGGTGILVNQSSGLVGSDQATITIRGVATVNSTSPLVLVDGVPYDMNNLDPNSVASITVLKDAAAASMYGARGANGVIVITTKRGVAGVINVNYNGYFGIQKAVYTPDFVNAPTYMQMVNQKNINTGGAPLYSQGAIDSTASGRYPTLYPNTNWAALTLRNSIPIQQHSLLVSGGNTASRFVIDINNTDQLGQLQELQGIPLSKYSRTTVRVNSTVDLTKNVLIYTDLFSARTDQTEPFFNYGGRNTSYFYSRLYIAPPNIAAAYPAKPASELPSYIPPGYTFYGNTGESWNPVALLALGGTQKTSSNLAMINMRPEWTIAPGLTLNGQASYNVGSGVQQVSENGHVYYNYFNYLSEGVPVTLQDYSSLQGGQTYFLWGGNLDFKRSAGKSSFTALLGYTQELSSNQLTDIALRSLFAKATYAYDERYLVEVGIRRDGSSIFGPGYQWGNFPSIALGWNIDKEPFFNIQEVTGWKIRVSYGSLGNNNVNPYQYQTTINGNGTENNIGNPDIHWEKTNMVNIGTDLSLKSGFEATIDWFNKRTNDVLFGVPPLLTGGIGSGTDGGNSGPLINAFSARVDGLEANLKYHKKLSKDFSFNVGLGYSRETSRIMKLLSGNAPIINGNTILYVGGPLYANYGYRTDGLLQQADINNPAVAKMPGEQAGDIKYVDVNHDGTITTKDMVPLGTTQPTDIFFGNLGFNYKGFDFDGLITGQAGAAIFYTGQLANPFNGGEETTPQKSQTDTWTPQNTNASLPRLTDGGNLAFSDFYKHSGTWERVRYLQVGYTFPQALSNKIRLKSLRIYFNAQNPFTISSVKLIDPESQGSLYTVPIMKAFTCGLNVKF
jgi:TonB-linked SusC/RagA family outer membrane protein